MGLRLWAPTPAGDTSTVGITRRSHHDYTALALADAKGELTISVCLPALNEAETIGAIVKEIRSELVESVPLVDELFVIDDHCTDNTADVAVQAGATVILAANVHTQYPGPGKGQALWKSLHQTTGDLVVWCDADLDQFGAHFIVGLLGPLITEPRISFVKGAYLRPDPDGSGGGRVTELVARPLLANLFPDLASIGQPLSGEYAGRRTLLESLPFVSGYGVDLALLIDVADTAGPDAIAEVDLGERRHRNRPLKQLGPLATEVMRAALSRASITHSAGGSLRVSDEVVLHRPDHEAVEISQIDLPPVVSLGSYRSRRSTS